MFATFFWQDVGGRNYHLQEASTPEKPLVLRGNKSWGTRWSLGERVRIRPLVAVSLMNILAQSPFDPRTQGQKQSQWSAAGRCFPSWTAGKAVKAFIPFQEQRPLCRRKWGRRQPSGQPSRERAVNWIEGEILPHWIRQRSLGVHNLSNKSIQHTETF